MFKHIAVMPDVHVGKGATVGSVVATQGAIVPAMVGVDIGCGMVAVKTDLSAELVKTKSASIRRFIESLIPVGTEGNRRPSKSVLAWSGWQDWDNVAKGDDALKEKAISQLGSLGGGNHFIELCIDLEGFVWIMLHSGSRNVGKTLAERHINTAKGQLKKKLVDLPDPDLAYFTEDTKEFGGYLHDLHWAQSYAFQNRVEMLERVMAGLVTHLRLDRPIVRLLQIDCHHNYVARETHFGREVLITRKGAVRARKGELGIIPGSMGAKSFIVRGKGNTQSYCSCSHGAGRRMSRGSAKRSFTVADLKAQTAGVDCRKDNGVLDEIPGAYKDINEVMANQADLVDVVAELKQILCVKG